MAVDVISVFGVLAGIVFIGFLAELVFKKTKIPDVLILMILGIIIGSVLKWVDKNDFGPEYMLFTTFTLIFLLFQGALSIDFRNLFLSLKGTAKLTLISFIITVSIVLLISVFMLGLDLMHSLLLGVILGGTSSAVVIPLVSRLSIDRNYGLMLTLESAISDVLCIVGTITVIAVINTGEAYASKVVQDILISFLMSGIIGFIIGLGWILALSKSNILRESYMVTIAMIVGLYAFVESNYVASNGAIAALTFGLVIGNSSQLLHFFYNIKNSGQDKTKAKEVVIESVLSTSAKSFYSEISFFVKIFFFVYLGILIDFSKSIIFLYGFVITAGIFIARIITIYAGFYKEEIDFKTKNILRFLVPKGLAAAVLAQLALQMGVPGAGLIVDIVFSVVLISIVVSSLMVFLIEIMAHFKGVKSTPVKEEESNDKYKQPAKYNEKVRGRNKDQD